MWSLETTADLDRLVAQDIQESLTLDYKDAAALDKSNHKRNELCKDVSAFANSAGGQIVYGVQESGHHPIRVQDTDGVDPAAIPREWIEQVIDSKVQPRIEGLRIKPIEVAPSRVAYVLTVPQAIASAPHMAPDNKYYYRQNFQSVPMDDYQVRDTFRRATTPELFVTLALASNPMFIEFTPNTEISKPIDLLMFVGNRSPQPAFHTILSIGVDEALPLHAIGPFAQCAARKDARGNNLNWLTRRISSPPEQPIFKEADLSLSQLIISFSVRSEHMKSSTFYLSTLVQTPGFEATESWVMLARNGYLTLQPRASA